MKISLFPKEKDKLEIYQLHPYYQKKKKKKKSWPAQSVSLGKSLSPWACFLINKTKE